MVLPLQFLLPTALGLVLTLSGALKFTSSSATMAAIRAFRLPVFLQARWVAYLLPVIEILLGLGLLLTSGGHLQVMGSLAAALFAVFTVLVAGVLKREETVSCNCFGVKSTEPIRWPMLVRNMLLTMAALALALGIEGSKGMPAALSEFHNSDYVWMFVVAALAAWPIAISSLLGKELAADSRRSVALDAGMIDLSGQPIPVLEFRDSALQVVKLQELPRKRAQLLLFARPGCDACGPIMDSLPTWRRELGSFVEIRVVSTHSPSSMGAAYPAEAASALYDGSSMGATILGIPGVPSALLLGTNGMVGAGPAVGPEAVTELFEVVAHAVNA